MTCTVKISSNMNIPHWIVPYDGNGGQVSESVPHACVKSWSKRVLSYSPDSGIKESRSQLRKKIVGTQQLANALGHPSTIPEFRERN